MHVSTIQLFIVLGILCRKCVFSGTIQKRQLFREQVSPQLGGKIPDSAFHTDRLALNQLQKVGIAIPDGVILEPRNPEVYQYRHKTKRPVYKVATTKDQRFTPKVGQYKTAESIETTYVIPQITQLKEHDLINIVRAPVHKQQLVIPHRLHHQHSLGNGGHHQRIAAIKNDVRPTIGTIEFLQFGRPYDDVFDSYLNFDYRPDFYSNFNQDYFIGPSIFNDFATFFDSYVHHK